MLSAQGLPDMLAAAVAADPARPLITFYDDATGERVELSGKVFGNWVAKTANLLVDGLDAQPGERVALLLPPHWQTAAWLFASWSAGLTVELPPGGEEVEAEVLAVAEAELPAVGRSAAREVVGLSLHALGGTLKQVPPGVLDYAAEVRSYGDRFQPYAQPDPRAPALVTCEGTGVTKITLTGQELLQRGREAAAHWALDAGSRVLVDMAFTTLQGLLAGLIAPLCSGGSVIICRNIDKAVLDRRVSVEHVTAVAGVPEWSDSSGSVHRLT